ncbi:MAG: cyclic nucleotide-binding domain-containing protein [Variovorax sp.]
MPQPARPIEAPNMRERAARMLMANAKSANLTFPEALVVTDSMRPQRVRAGTLLMQEGASEDTGYMALVLEGEVRADTNIGIPDQDIVISVLGAGSMLGEMGFIDGAPRSASCTALTDLKLAILSREALLDLIENHPAIASRLLMAISGNLSERLRDTNRRLRTVSQVGTEVQRELAVMQRELDAAHSVNRKLLLEPLI